MTAAVIPLAAAVWTALTMLSLGVVLVQAFRLPLRRDETFSIGYLLGAACLSLAVFTLAAASILSPVTLGAIGMIAVLAAVFKGAWRYEVKNEAAPIATGWKIALVAAAVVYGVYTFVHAWAPETSPDGVQYHLGLVQRYLRQGGFGHITTNMYANMPMGVDMLFVYAFAFGRHSAAALVHWTFLVVSGVLLVQFGRRFNMPGAGATAALLVTLSPVVQIDGSSAYVDVALLATVFGLFYLLIIDEWDRGERPRWGLPAATGVLAGFAFACKMPAGLAVPFAAAYLMLNARRARQPLFRPAILCLAFSAISIAPWLIKSAILVDNPLSPFANRLFPNRYISVGAEESYRNDLRTYWGTVPDPRAIPMEVTVHGHKLAGLLGPVFLLTPLALLALRWPMGRRMLIACAVFLIPYPTNIGTRFLLPALPFAAFALGIVLVRWQPAAAVLIAFHAFTAWPGVMAAYADENAWRLKEWRLKQALRRESEHDFLMRRLPEYRASQLIEQHVPQGERVLAWSGPAQAYTSRELLVPYQAAFNMRAAQTLAAGMVEGFQAVRQWTFRFEPVEVSALRLVLTTGSKVDEWSISEFRVFNGSREVLRKKRWRIRGWPNPWDIPLAFDGCPGTRWVSAQLAEPDMYVQLDFGSPRPVSEVRTEMTPDQTLSARLEGRFPEGWRTLGKSGEWKGIPAIRNTRLNASDDLKRMGIRYVMAANSESFATDFLRNQKAWGVTLLGETELARLYRID